MLGKTILTTAIITIAVGLVLVGSATNANAQRLCEYPIFVKQAATTPNVIILFDNSSSMNEVIYLDGYDPNSNYSGDFSGSRTYSVRSNGDYTPRDFSRRWSSSPSAYLVASDGGKDGDYSGNYLNWLYFHATAAERALSVGHLTRIQAAKIAVNFVLTKVPGVRFGIWDFNDDKGGKEVSPLSIDIAALAGDVNAIVGDAYTPLAESLEDIYDALTTDPSMIQAYCQKTFIVIITDGYPTKDISVNARFLDYDGDGNDPGDCASVGAPYSNSLQCSDYLDDVALYLFKNDLRPDLDGPDPGDDLQNAVTYTIGFTLNAPFLQETALNGGGVYATANNPSDLANALISTLLDISERVSSGTSATVVSAENSTTSRVFRARFTPGVWEGELEAFDLPYVSGASPVWQAGYLLNYRTPDSRNIYTSTSGTNTVEFTLGNQGTIQTFLNTADADTASDIIKWVRGSDLPGYKERAGWKLGDIVDSSPAPVGPPSSFHDFLDYNTFRVNNQSRQDMIYVGTNNGMIHGFRQDTGEEEWAFIPRNHLPNLKAQLSPFYCHQYYVNLTPVVFDAYFNGSWKTVLLVGQREGGNGYTALDVTDPRAGQVSVLWDKAFPDVSESWARPTLVRDKSLDKYVLAVGSGLDDSGDANMLVLNVADGSILDNQFLEARPTGANSVTETIVLDTDFDGYDDLGYVGDLDGNIWRFDFSTFPWTKSKLFDTAGQPIEARPTVTFDDKGQALVLFGTGEYIKDADIADTSTQTFYCVQDDHQLGATLTKDDLTDQTSSFNVVDASSRGWYIDLENTGERVNKPAALAAGTVYFVSFKPNSASCESGGVSWLWEVDYGDGSNPDNADESEDDYTEKRRNDLGEGIYSEPTIDLANEDVLVQSTKTAIESRDAKGRILRVLVRSWRERYN